MHFADKLEFKVVDLVQKVKDNREKHAQDFEVAVEVYRKDLVDALKERLALAEENQPVELDLGLVKPVHYLKDYDRAIAMLEMTSQNTIELDQRTFGQLVMDEWDWRHSFESNTGYFRDKAAIYAMGSPRPGAYSRISASSTVRI